MKKMKSANSLARWFARGLSRGIITSILVSAACVSSSASDSKMEFVLVDGSVNSIDSTNLEMTFTDNALIAFNGASSLEIPLSDLSKFYFTDSMTNVEINPVNPVEYGVTDLSGCFFGKFSTLDDVRSTLPSGVYVINNGTLSFKLAVK